MKKTLTLLLLVLAITTSLIAGTMAYYTVTLDNLVQGEVVAKEFIFVEKAGQQTLSFSDKMAPGETVECLCLASTKCTSVAIKKCTTS